jgi:hypothetical protein
MLSLISPLSIRFEISLSAFPQITVESICIWSFLISGSSSKGIGKPYCIKVPGPRIAGIVMGRQTAHDMCYGDRAWYCRQTLRQGLHGVSIWHVMCARACHR